MNLERRKFIGRACKTALTVVGGYVVAVNTPHMRAEKKKKATATTIGPIEDLDA